MNKPLLDLLRTPGPSSQMDPTFLRFKSHLLPCLFTLLLLTHTLHLRHLPEPRNLEPCSTCIYLISNLSVQATLSRRLVCTPMHVALIASLLAHGLPSAFVLRSL